MDFSILSIEDVQKLPGALLWRTSKLWQNSMHAALTDLGLSSTNAIVLSNMLHFELEHEKITQARLAALCDVDRMTASTILRGLVRKGLVERKVSRADKRGLELSLTSEGRAVAQIALGRIGTVHQEFFELMNDEERERLTTGLSKLLAVNTADRNM